MECNLKLSEINNFDSMFLTNSIIRVLPVRHLENVSFQLPMNLKV